MSETAPANPETAPTPNKGSSIRLMVLLAILLVVLAGYLVDLFSMYDGVKAATKRLDAAHEEVAAKAVGPNEKHPYLSRDAVEKAIGFPPTTSSTESGVLVEFYRWWGAIPLQRRFIEVSYKDPEGKDYHSYKVSNPRLIGDDEAEEAAELEKANTPAPVEGEKEGKDGGGKTAPPMPTRPMTDEPMTESEGTESPAEGDKPDDTDKPDDDTDKPVESDKPDGDTDKPADEEKPAPTDSESSDDEAPSEK